MIFAVATVLNEVDIVGTTVASLFANGVDEVYIALAERSDDGTREVLEATDAHVVEDREHFHFQPMWINRLISDAVEKHGPGWVIPFDADEIHYATDGGTIRESLLALPEDVRKLHVRAFQHRDWDHRERDYRSMGKVAFRWAPGAWVSNGNHDCSIPGPAIPQILDLREWQFRSFEHLQRKCHERVDRLDPTLPYTEGTHQRVLAALTEEELKVEWARMQAVPVEWDPIPVAGI